MRDGQTGMRKRFRKEGHVLGFDPLSLWCPRCSWCGCPGYIGNMDLVLKRQVGTGGMEPPMYQWRLRWVPWGMATSGGGSTGAADWGSGWDQKRLVPLQQDLSSISFLFLWHIHTSTDLHSPHRGSANLYCKGSIWNTSGFVGYILSLFIYFSSIL